MNRIRASGRSGELKFGYKTAARLSDWTLDGTHFHGNVEEVDEMWIDRGGPFELRLPFGRKFWVWRDVMLTSTDPLAARLTSRPDVRD